MSPWDQLQQQQEKRRAQKKRLVVAVFVGMGLAIAAAFIVIPRLFAPDEQPDLGDLVASQDEGASAAQADKDDLQNEETGGRQPAGSTAPFSLVTSGAADEEAAKLARLEQNLLNRDVAQFKKQPARTRGPQRLTYTVSGSGQTHAFSPGQATFGDTDIVGAAGEWVVRPWWNPGWVPNSADCGEIGTAAVAGHVSWAGRPGPFHDLGAMTVGDEINCQSSSGRWFTYTVTEVVRIDYTNTDYYNQPSSATGRELTLFSCTPEISGIVVVRARVGG